LRFDHIDGNATNRPEPRKQGEKSDDVVFSRRIAKKTESGNWVIW
jgi:hypothetical protein